jgi:hypothetical protein
MNIPDATHIISTKTEEHDTSESHLFPSLIATAIAWSSVLGRTHQSRQCNRQSTHAKQSTMSSKADRAAKQAAKLADADANLFVTMDEDGDPICDCNHVSREASVAAGECVQLIETGQMHPLTVNIQGLTALTAGGLDGLTVTTLDVSQLTSVPGCTVGEKPPK